MKFIQGSNKRSLVTKLVLILLSLLVAVPGLGVYFAGQDDSNIVAKVGKIAISTDEYNRAYEGELAYLQNVMQVSLTRQQMEALGLGRAVLNRLVENKLIDNLVHDLGLDVGHDNVLKYIQGVEVFQKDDRSFDTMKFESFLKQIGVSQPAFYEIVKQDMLRDMLMRSVFEFSVNFPNVAEDIHRHLFQNRTVDIISFTPDMVKPIEPAASALEKVYEDNKSSFYTQEMRDISYMFLRESDLREEIVLTDEEIDEGINALPYSSKVVVRYRRFDSAEESSKARESLMGKEDFWRDWEVISGNFSQDLYPVLEGMSVKDLSGVASLEDGFYLFYLEDKYGSESELMKSLEERFMEVLRDAKVKSALSKFVKILGEEFLDSEVTLETVSAKHGMRIYSTGDPVSIDEMPEDLKHFASMIFNSKIGVISDFIEDDKGFFSFVVNKVRPPELKPLNEVMTVVRKMWEKQYLLEQLKLQAESFISDWKSGSKVDMGGFKVSGDIVWRMKAAVTENPKQNYPVDFVDQVFELGSGDVSGSVEFNDSVILGILRAVNDPQPGALKVSEIDANIKGVIIDSLNKDIKEYLLSKYEVKVFPGYQN